MDICNGVCPHDGMFLMREPTLLKAGATGENLYYKVQDILYDDTFALYTASPEVNNISIQTLIIAILSSFYEKSITPAPKVQQLYSCGPFIQFG